MSCSRGNGSRSNRGGRNNSNRGRRVEVLQNGSGLSKRADGGGNNNLLRLGHGDDRSGVDNRGSVGGLGKRAHSGCDVSSVMVSHSEKRGDSLDNLRSGRSHSQVADGGGKVGSGGLGDSDLNGGHRNRRVTGLGSVLGQSRHGQSEGDSSSGEFHCNISKASGN